MLGIDHYWLFVLSGLILNITPGSDTLYILSRTVSQGRSAGLISVFGIVSGAVVHTCLAALGLSVILMNSAIAFHLIKWLGAAYLIYLGVKFLRTKTSQGMDIERQKESRLRPIYVQGLLTNLLNPKVALFYLAFLPQFISPGNPYGVWPFLILGFTFITTGTLWCMVLVMGSAFMTRKLRGSRVSGYLHKVSGVVFIVLGLKLLGVSRT